MRSRPRNLSARGPTTRPRCARWQMARPPIRAWAIPCSYHPLGSTLNSIGCRGRQRCISCPCSWHRASHRRGSWWIRGRVISGYPAKRRPRTKAPTGPSRWKAGGLCACRHACTDLRAEFAANQPCAVPRQHPIHIRADLRSSGPAAPASQVGNMRLPTGLCRASAKYRFPEIEAAADIGSETMPACAADARIAQARMAKR